MAEILPPASSKSAASSKPRKVRRKKAAPKKSKTVTNALGSITGPSGTSAAGGPQGRGGHTAKSSTDATPVHRPTRPSSKPAPKKSSTVTKALEGVTGKPSKAKPKKPKGKQGETVAAALGSVTGKLTPKQKADREALRKQLASGKLGGDNIKVDTQSVLGQVVDFAVKRPGKLPGTGGKAPLGTVAATPTPSTGKVYVGAGAAALNIARATAEDPVGVSKATANSVPLIARGMAAAGAELVTHPRQFIKTLPKTVRDDYVRRYGNVLDDPKAFRERLKKDGILPEILDVSSLGVPTVSVGGRIATKVAESGAAGSRAKAFVDAPRPGLRVGAGPREVRPQAKSPNAARLAAQRAKDASRAKAAAKRRADAKPFRGLEPGPGEVVKKSLRAQSRGQRRVVARVSARTQARVVRDIDREVRGKTGVVGNAKKLTKEERAALPLVIRMGLPADPAKAVAALRKYKAMVLKERARTGRPVSAVDNLKVVDAIIANPAKYLTPKVREVADAEVLRGKRVAEVNPSVSRENALRRQHDDQAALVGVERKPAPVERRTPEDRAEVARVEAMRAGAKTPAEVLAYMRAAEKLADPEPVPKFVARVKEAAAKDGLTEPGYVYSREFDRGGAGAYAGGNVGRAVKGDKQNQSVLFKHGAADSSIETMQLGIARGLKRAHNWHGVADTLERNAPTWGRNMGIQDLERAIRGRGLDPADWAFIDTGTIRKTLDDGELASLRSGASTESSAVNAALRGNTLDLDGAVSRYSGTGQRFTAIPRAVSEELNALTQPGGSVARAFQKFQGAQSKVLLGLNPTFVPIQVVSNTPLAMLALRGNVKALLDGQRWYKALDQPAKDVVDEYIGASASASFGAAPRFGEAADSRLTRFYESVATNQRLMGFREGKGNPLNWNPLLDGKQNAFFRRAVFYDAARRSAGKRMSDAARGIIHDAEPLMDALRMPPGPARDAALRRAEPEAERIADKVDSLLGDYTIFTAKERKYLKTTVLFYGFMRWATQLAFYTLPIKHPVATSIAGKLGQLHNEEVISLLSDEAAAMGIGNPGQVEDLLRRGAMPYVFGRVWFTKDGNLEYVDATRLNPLLGPLMESAEAMSKKGVVGGGFKGVLSLPSPAISAGLDAAYGKSSFTGQDLVDQDGNPLGGSTRFVAGQMLNTAFPIRVADQVLNPGTKSDDSLPLIDPRLKPSTGEAAAGREAQKRDERGSDANVLLDNLLPIGRSRRDGTMRGIARIANDQSKRKAKRKAGGSAPTGVLTPQQIQEMTASPMESDGTTLTQEQIDAMTGGQ